MNDNTNNNNDGFDINEACINFIKVMNDSISEYKKITREMNMDFTKGFIDSSIKESKAIRAEEDNIVLAMKIAINTVNKMLAILIIGIKMSSILSPIF